MSAPESNAALVDYVARSEAVFRGIRWRGFGDATVTHWCEQMEDQARLLVDAFDHPPEPRSGVEAADV